MQLARTSPTRLGPTPRLTSRSTRHIFARSTPRHSPPRPPTITVAAPSHPLTAEGSRAPNPPTSGSPPRMNFTLSPSEDPSAAESINMSNRLGLIPTTPTPPPTTSPSAYLDARAFEAPTPPVLSPATTPTPQPHSTTRRTCPLTLLEFIHPSVAPPMPRPLTFLSRVQRLPRAAPKKIHARISTRAAATAHLLPLPSPRLGSQQPPLETPPPHAITGFRSA